jgi:DNA-binding MarR family transcriptional regulator
LLGIEKTTLTRNLQTLETQGCIRIESGKDKRTRLIRITSQGLSLVKKAFPFWKKAQAVVAKSISPDILQELANRAENIDELI